MPFRSSGADELSLTPPDFFLSADSEPHAARTRAILADHPDVQKLIGRNPWTAIIMIAVVSLQTCIAGFLGHVGHAGWWLSFLLAYAVGAFANHCLYVVIHEATHNLIFRNRALNRLVAVLADMPNVVPGAMAFRAYHLAHHKSPGKYDSDLDLPSRWEARLIGQSAFRKMIWLLCLPAFQIARESRVDGVRWKDRWAALNVVLCVAYSILIFVSMGLGALLYLFASFWFSVSLHPMGAQWIQAHYTINSKQETFSYYGPLNLVALNMGYHNEHHDFPAIPWNHLPKLRRLAPEFYDSLDCHRSFVKLLFNFIFNHKYSLFSRIVRAS